jgi:hypothetical protein
MITAGGRQVAALS